MQDKGSKKKGVYTEVIEVEVGGMAVGSDFYPAPCRGEIRPHGHQFQRDGVEHACLRVAARSRLLLTTTFSLSMFLNAGSYAICADAEYVSDSR